MIHITYSVDAFHFLQNEMENDNDRRRSLELCSYDYVNNEK